MMCIHDQMRALNLIIGQIISIEVQYNYSANLMAFYWQELPRHVLPNVHYVITAGACHPVAEVMDQGADLPSATEGLRARVV